MKIRWRLRMAAPSARRGPGPSYSVCWPRRPGQGPSGGSCDCRRKGTVNTLAALKSIRAARPDGAPVYIVLDNLSAGAAPGLARLSTLAQRHRTPPRHTRFSTQGTRRIRSQKGTRWGGRPLPATA